MGARDENLSFVNVFYLQPPHKKLLKEKKTISSASIPDQRTAKHPRDGLFRFASFS
jgi:hypothetical protein